MAKRGNSASQNVISIRQSLLVWVAFSKRFRKTWEAAWSLFDPRNVEKTFSGALPEANTDYAALVFAISALLCFLTIAIPLIVSAYLANSQAEIIQDITETAQPRVGPAELGPPLLLSFILFVPLGFLLSLALEWGAFHLLRLLGGKGTLAQQLSLTSVIMLASALLSGLNIFSPLPCLNLITLLAVMVGSVYLFLVVESKAYAMAHGISRGKGFAVALLVALLRVAVFYLAVAAIAPALGVYAQIRL